MHDEIFDRADERIVSLGLSEDVTKRKLAEYAALRESRPQGMSSVGMVNIAEDLMTSVHWLITGERDPFELRSTARNVLCGATNAEPGPRWLLAKKVFNDPATAYQQVELGPSENFQWSEPGNTKYAEEKLWELRKKAEELSYFELIEECFGVDVIILDSPEDFTALGGMVCGSPSIVVKQGIDTTVGNYAVAAELVKIMVGNLFWSSDVFADGEDFEPSNHDILWVLDFTSQFTNPLDGDLLPDVGSYAFRRFPERLIEAHRKAVAEKRNLGYFLDWMEQ